MNKQIIFKKKEIYTKDKTTEKLRLWDPTRSKLSAGIKKGMIFDFKEDLNILYLGAAEGYTVSFLSDILSKGEIFSIDISPYSMQKLLLLAERRTNIIPILGDCNIPDEYKEIIDKKFDLIIQDIAQKNQVEILIKNTDLFLKEKGKVILSLKLSAISQKDHKKTTEDQLTIFRRKFNIINQKRLDPFEKKHVLIYGEKK